MRAYLWLTLGLGMWACGGSPFTSDADVGSGGRDEPGAGVGNAASTSGGSVGTAGRGGKPGAGGSGPIAGSATTGGAQNAGGLGMAGDPGCEPLPECQDIEPGSSCDDSVTPPCAIDGYIFCACTGCSGSGPCTSETVWRCAEGSGSNSCPHIMPNEGQACFDDTECSYGSCATDSHMDVSCDGSSWSWTSAQCPQ